MILFAEFLRFVVLVINALVFVHFLGLQNKPMTVISLITMLYVTLQGEINKNILDGESYGRPEQDKHSDADESGEGHGSPDSEA